MSTEKKVVEINVQDILPNRFQPRIKFDEEAISDLSASIKEHGVIQPLVVRQVGDKYEIIAGERRYKASVMAGLETVPAIITKLNDKDSAEVALIENVQRQNLTPIEEAVSYKKILDMGYLTQEQLANKLGKSQSALANKLRLLNLSDDVQEALLNGQISERHARSLLKLNNKKQQIKMLNRIIDERLTVRRTDEEIDKMLNELFEADDNEIEKEVDVTNNVDGVEDEIEHTQPLSFDFSSFEDNGPKSNVFDEQEKQENNTFGMESTDSTDFFGFNQNIMSDEEENNYDSVEPIEEEKSEEINTNDFVDVNKIQEQSEDLYPEDEKKDINSFLEPTLLLNEEEEKPEKEESNPSTGFTFDEINSSVESEDTKESKEDTKNDIEVNPFENLNKEDSIELNNDMKPGKFFNLFNDFDNEQPVEENNINSLFGEPTQEPNRIDDNPFDFNSSFNDEENSKEEISQENIFGNFGTMSFEDETNESDQSEEINAEDELEAVIPQKLEAEEINEENDEQPSESNIDLAREKIKLYAEELKKLGIDMNIEESDFENKYQITINIDK